MPNSNRDKGHNYEREVRKKFRDLGFDCQTARRTSRYLDDLGIDLTGIPINIQCKATDKSIKYQTLIKSIKKVIKKYDEYPTAVFHKRDGRREEGKLVVMTERDFFKLLSTWTKKQEKM